MDIENKVYSYSEITIKGNVASEVAMFNNDLGVTAYFTVAINHWGLTGKKTVFVKVRVNGSMAESAAKLIKKGMPILVKGEFDYSRSVEVWGEKREFAIPRIRATAIHSDDVEVELAAKRKALREAGLIRTETMTAEDVEAHEKEVANTEVEKTEATKTEPAKTIIIEDEDCDLPF